MTPLDAVLALALPGSVLLVMVAVGLELTGEDLRRTVAQPRALGFAVLCQMVVTPLIGFALAKVLGLRPDLAVGLVVLASCPGGSGSNVLTYIVGADTALSIGVSAITSVATLVTIPLIVGAASLAFMGEAGAVPVPFANAVGQLLLLCLVPIAVGVGIRRRWPARAERWVRPLGRLGTTFLVVASFVLFYGFWDKLTADFPVTLPTCALLFASTLALGGLGALALGLSRRTAVTLALEVGFQNVALASLITVTLLDRPELSIVSASYGIVCLCVLVPWALWRRGSFQATLAS